jgi:hypothetical protein
MAGLSSKIAQRAWIPHWRYLRDESYNTVTLALLMASKDLARENTEPHQKPVVSYPDLSITR